MYECDNSNVSICHVARMNASCRTYANVMSRVWMSHVACMYEWVPGLASYDTLAWSAISPHQLWAPVCVRGEGVGVVADGLYVCAGGVVCMCACACVCVFDAVAWSVISPHQLWAHTHRTHIHNLSFRLPISCAVTLSTHSHNLALRLSLLHTVTFVVDSLWSL